MSQGWVRCGRCGEAFNALESMVELPPPRLHASLLADEPSSAPAVDHSSLQDPDGPDEPRTTGLGDIDLIASDGAIDHRALTGQPAGASSSSDSGGEMSTHTVGPREDDVRLLAASAPVEPRPASPVAGGLHSEVPGAAPQGAPASPAQSVRPPPAQPGDGPGPALAPSFIVKADRAERWRRPGVRLALALGIVIAAVSLTLQMVHTYRDRVAAMYPRLKPLLVLACGAVDCQIADVRQIDALSVESSALVRVDGSSVYRLNVTLRNRAAIELAAPALDLSLNDGQGSPIARRTLTMADLQLPLRTLKPGSELPIQVPLGISDRLVRGYTVEIFYP